MILTMTSNLRFYLAISCLLMLPSIVMAESLSLVLKAEQWDMPRHGEALIKQPQLKQIALRWAENPSRRIELRYPGGEEGELWVQELVDWMVSLGIPSTALIKQPGSSAEDVIQLILQEPN